MKSILSVCLLLVTGLAKADLPLETTRNIRFDTEQVSWLSLDVHPNGSTLVFEALGDLYTLPIAGGQATRITEGPAFDSQPRYSPDGNRIVFVSDRSGSENLWVLETGTEEPKQITKEKGTAEFASPIFSPDGEHIVTSRSTWGLRTFELWGYHVDGGKGVQITKANANGKTPSSQRPNALGAVYSPDGRYLYYARKAGGFAYNVRLPLWQIARRDLLEGREDILTAAQGSAFRPVISPDGTQLVYATRYEQQTGLRIRDLETGADRWLAYPVEHDEQESRFTRDLFPGYAFAPDGESLLYAANGRIEQLELTSGKARRIPMSVPIDQQLGPHLDFPYRVGQGPVKARLLQDPELSPDGSKLAFAAFMSIYVHDLVKKTTKRITDESLQAFHPTWSPNGKKLAFVSWKNGGGHIHDINARGGRARQLTATAAHYTDPVYSPDGNRLVALRGSAHERLMREWDYGPAVGADVIWLPARGGEGRTILPAAGLTQPHFGSDPERILLYRSQGIFPSNGSGGLISIRFDGSDRRDIISTKGPGIYSAEGDVASEDARLSPDETNVLVQHANQLYLIKRLGTHIGRVDHLITAPKLPQAKLTDVGADYFGWSADGQSVYWTVGHTLFQRPVESIEFAKEKDESDEDDGEKKEETPEPVSAEQAESVTSHLIELYKPRYEPSGTLMLTNATILTMTADSAPVSSASVIINGSRIEAVGTDLTAPEGAEVIDMNGAFILPGFIDTHAHFRPLRGTMDRDNPAFLANLAYGVTTGLDVQPSTVDIIAYEDMIDAGLITGPRALSTGPGIFKNNDFKSKEHARHVLERYQSHYGVHNLKAYITGSRKQRQWLAQAAAELKLMPTTEGGLDVKMDLTHILDGFSGNEHNLPLVNLYDDVVKLMAESRIAYTPTLLVTYGGPWAETYFYTQESPRHDEKLARFTPYPNLANRTLRLNWAHPDEHTFDEMAAQAAKVVRAGGRVGVGGHGQLQGLGYHWEMWALSMGGFTPLEVLTAATRHGAEMIGVAQDLGTIEAGKLADLLILAANPLENIRNTSNIRYVVKNGELFSAETLDKIWPEKTPLADQWWWHLAPESRSEKQNDE